MSERHNNSEDQFLIFGQPQIHQDEIDEVVDSLRKAWLGTGPKVSRFESEFARYKGTDSAHVAAVNSCTAALHISMLAAGIEPEDEVITTPMTFCATVNAIVHAGATPVLADIDPVSMNIDPAQIEKRITPRTRGVVPVHFAGRPCDMKSIMSLANKYGLKVIEDCAHAIESELDGRKAGTFGDFGCFSFYATKNVTTGEGGMILARDTSDIERAKILALHGMTKDAWKRFSDAGHVHYFVVECGFKYNMMDLQAAIGIHQLARVESSWNRRREIWERYQDEFSGLPVVRPTEPEAGSRHAYHLYTLQIDPKRCGISRDAFLDAMIDCRIGVGVHYLSIAQHPYYQQRFGWRPADYPNAWKVGEETVSLPLSPKLSQSDVERVIHNVRSILRS
ncbi:MAG: DegT/DnrJ/EryC1/StrS family aminotransferase [Gammaproteobacteria bacterium]|nr:DegT/DnrJ/EryC1/StrS family aminotransferase [Gammaproteobacteria bacterium]